MNCTEKDITTALNRHYNGNARYKLANAFIFKDDWESDFFVQKQNGYSYEFEVKISRSDFFADKKKVTKHLILSTGKFIHQKSLWNDNRTGDDDKWIIEETEREHTLRPNKYFYVVPVGLITIDELPNYAGLLTYDKDTDSITSVKEAPFIHKEKIDFSTVLCPKFYNYWIDAKNLFNQLKYEYDYYTEECRKLREELSALKKQTA